MDSGGTDATAMDLDGTFPTAATQSGGTDSMVTDSDGLLSTAATESGGTDAMVTDFDGSFTTAATEPGGTATEPAGPSAVALTTTDDATTTTTHEAFDALSACVLQFRRNHSVHDVAAFQALNRG